MINKLDGFEPLYIINLARRTDRKELSLKQLIQHDVKNYTFVEAVDAQKDNLPSMYAGYHSQTNHEIACTLSHLKAIKQWLDTSDSDYAIIMEDDFSFEILNYWKFSFKEFIDGIDFDYDMLQLCIIHGNMDLEMHERNPYDYSAAVYLIKRSHAEKFINSLFYDNLWHLPQKALADTFIYESGVTYSIPLFTYSMATGSDINPDHMSIHEDSRNKVLNYWKNK